MKMNKMHSGWKKEDLDTFFEKSYFCLHCWTEHDILWRFSKTDPSYELHYCPHQHPNDSGIKEDVVDTLEDDLDEAESIIARIKKKTPKMAKKLQKALPRMRKLKQFYETPLQDQIDNKSLPYVQFNARNSNSGFVHELVNDTGHAFKYGGILATIIGLPILGPFSLVNLVMPATIHAMQKVGQNKMANNFAQKVQSLKELWLRQNENKSNFVYKTCELMLQDPTFVNCTLLKVRPTNRTK